MVFQWIQHGTRSGEMQKWSLVHKDSRVVVADMWFSPYAGHARNSRLRRKIKAAYELYYQTVWFGTLKFF